MNGGRKTKKIASKPKQGSSRENPPGQWKLRVTRKMRKSAQKFHNALLRIYAREEGEFPQPIMELTVRLQFQRPLSGSRATELIQVIGAASARNLDNDAQAYARLLQLLDRLARQAEKGQSEASMLAANLGWAKLLAQIQEVQQHAEELGQPPYGNSAISGVEGSLDFMSMWRDRERYTNRLAELEKTVASRRADLNRLEAKRPGVSRGPYRPAPLPIETSVTEFSVSVTDLLGGPLCSWVSQIGKSVSPTEWLSMEPQWRDLATVYCELHLKSGLLDFEVLGIEGGPENPFWDEARELLRQAQRHLLDFLKAACEVDSPAAVTKVVAQVKKTRVKNQKTKPTVSTNEKPDRKMVCIQRTGEEGSALKVLVDGVEVGDEASTTKKVLLAACILHLRSRNYDWWETKDLMALALTAGELEVQGKDRAKDLGNWKRTLLASPHRLSLETQQAGRRFRLTGIEFQTSMKEPELQSALLRFSVENPIERRTRGKRS